MPPNMAETQAGVPIALPTHPSGQTAFPSKDKAPASEKSPLLPTHQATVHKDSAPGHGIGGGSLFSAVFNLSTTSIGAGIMALPATMKVLGLPLGILVIALMGVLTDLSIALIMRFSFHLGARSYGDLMAAPFGRWGRRLIQAFTLIHTLGSLIVYMIIVGDVMSGTAAVGDAAHHSGLLEEIAGGPTFWNGRTPVMFATAVFVLYPLVSLRQIDSLMFTSALSIGLAVVFVLFIVVAAVDKGVKGQLEPARWLPEVGSVTDFVQIFTVIPVMTNAFICHYNIHPIYEELSNPTEERMRRVSKYSQTLCTLVYVATALFGYLLFGESTASDVLANFDSQLGTSQLLQDLVRLGYVVHLMLVFPIVFYPLRQTLDDVLFPSSPPLVSATWRFQSLTCALMAAIFCTSIFIPDIYVLFSFMGAIVAVSVGFTFPALIALRSMASDVHEGERWEVWLMLAVGLLVSSTGLATDVYDLAMGLFS